MPFVKGQSGNAKGRKKGTPNKATAASREWITTFLEKKSKQFMKSFDLLEPKDQCTIYEKLLQYTTPKAQRIELDYSQLSDEQLQAVIDGLTEKIGDEPDDEK
jgi:hypothetical protein